MVSDNTDVLSGQGKATTDGTNYQKRIQMAAKGYGQSEVVPQIISTAYRG